jgi:hypothetical protein
MSTLSAALAAFLQNDNTIGPLITGIISDRNFENQEKMLTDEPRTCLAISDLIEHQSSYVGTSSSGNVRKMQQIEVRIISRVSDAYVDGLKDTICNLLWVTSSLPSDGTNLPFGVTGIMPAPDIDHVTKTWFNILTIDCRS